MKTCSYQYTSGKKCTRPVFKKEGGCILHCGFPDIHNLAVFQDVSRLKREKFIEELEKENYHFEGVVLPDIDLSGKTITDSIYFDFANIHQNVYFEMSNIQGSVFFRNAKVSGKVYFEEAVIRNNVEFQDTVIDGEAHFYAVQIGGNALFQRVHLSQNALFRMAKISGSISLDKAVIHQNASFDGLEVEKNATLEDVLILGNLSFIGARIKKGLILNGSQIKKHGFFDNAYIGLNAEFYHMDIMGELTFYKAVFKIPKAQEDACSRAKRSLEELGNREGADYHFYHEMVAKRKQKKHLPSLIEYVFIESVFGYGVYWNRILISWFLLLVGCGLMYWIGHGIEGKDLTRGASLFESLYFSIVTVTTIGYGDYFPRKGFFQALSSLEAIIGTFMWAAFIAIFARKYMR
jgi:hypothetical protein